MPEALQLLLVVVAAAVGFILARRVFSSGEMPWRQRWFRPSHLPSNDTLAAKVELGLFLVGVQGAVWLAGTLFLFRSLLLVGEKARPSWTAVVCCVVALCLLGGLMFTVRPEAKGLVNMHIGLGNKGFSLTRLPAFIGVGIGAALAQVFGMWLVAAGIESHTWCGVAGLAEFLDLRALIDNHLLIASTILGLGTLAAGILRSTINEQEKKDWMLALHVIIFGLGYSFLLALAYAPAYLVTQQVGQGLADQLVDKSAISGFLTARKGLDELLRLQPGSFALTGAIPIAAPFFIGLISAWLKDAPKDSMQPPSSTDTTADSRRETRRAARGRRR